MERFSDGYLLTTAGRQTRGRVKRLRAAFSHLQDLLVHNSNISNVHCHFISMNLTYLHVTFLIESVVLQVHPSSSCLW